MEVLNGFSVDAFKVSTWVASLLVGVLLTIGSPLTSRLKIVSTLLKCVLWATITFVVLNMAVVVYILIHPTDPRWSAGKDAAVAAPHVSGGPLFDPITDTLNTILANMTGNLNDVIAFKNAFLTIPDFVIAAGWALLLAVPLIILVRLVGWLEERQRQAEIDETVRVTRRNARDIAAIKRHINLPSSDQSN